MRIKMGTSTNLILGFNPSWEPGSQDKTGLFLSPQNPLEEKEIVPPIDTDACWSYPRISLHDDSEALLSAVFPFRIVNPSDGVDEAEIAAGALLIGDHDRNEAIAALSKTIGVDLGNPDYGFVLVQLRKEVGTVAHPVVKNGVILHPHPLTPHESFGVENAFRSDLIKLRSPSGDDGHFDPSAFTKDHAQKCLDRFQSYGTHFVSQVRFGDIIFQVFAYQQSRFAKVKKAFHSNNFRDENALNFLMYTTDATTGSHGYVKEYGKLLSMSGDQKLKDDISRSAWLDKQWSEKDSIFAPYIDCCQIDFIALRNDYLQVAPIGYALTSLTIFAEFERRRALKRVFKGVMIQKFKQAVVPHFEKFLPYDFSSLPAYDDIAGFVTTIATTSMNSYKPNIDLGDLQFVGADKCDQFTLCANVVSSARSEVIIPGKDIAIVFQMGNFENDKDVAHIVVDDAAFDRYALSCRSVYGCLQISNSSGTKRETINDGIRYQYGGLDEQGRYLVAIRDDVRTVPDQDLLPRLKDSLTFAFTFANSILGGCSAEDSNGDTCAFAEDAMRWLGDVIPKECADLDLLDLRVSALDAVRSIRNPSFGAFVPLLPPDEYQEQVTNILNYTDAITAQITQYQEIIETRKTQELIIDVGKVLNENILQTGQLLAKFVQANANQQRDLSSYYDAIITQKQAELTQSYSKISKAQISVDEQRLKVENAVTAYKQAVQDWKIRQEIQFGLDVATTIFSAVTSFAIPASSISAVKDLGLSVQRIQKLLNILNNSYKVFNSNKASLDNLRNAQTALDDLDDCNFAVNSTLAWDELNANMSYLLNCGPALEAKSDLQREFTILVLRGKALLSAKDSCTQLAKDIYSQQRLNVLSANQQKRLDALSDSLQPSRIGSLDPLSLDLVGMTGNLMFLRTQMLGTLAKTLLLQDQALQYRNLQPATVITSFDLLNFKGAIVKQGQNTINALTKLSAIQESSTETIEITVQVPAAKLIHGSSYDVNISLDNRSFHEYVDARVQAVVVSVDGISATESGKYLVKLAYPGNSFFDRDPERNMLCFRTAARERVYEFVAGTDKPKFTDQGESWSAGVNPVTPFSTWTVSLPSTSVNQGIRFKDVMVEVSLKFLLKARIVDSLKLRGMAAPWPAAEAELLLFGASGAGASPNAPSIQNLVQGMQNRTVLNGWDAVFNMTLENIQGVLNRQYDELKASTTYGGAIDVTTKTKVTSTITAYKKFDLKYGYPKLSFMANDPTNVRLEIPVESGFVQSGAQMGDGPVNWDPRVDVVPGALIVATVPIGKVAGKVTGDGDPSKIMSVVLNLAAGTFSAKNMEVDNDDEKAAFNIALINYFTGNEVLLIINSLDLNGVSIIQDLCPTGFLFKTLITRTFKNEILQLFITTNSRTVQDYSQAFINDVDEPISIGDECSLMISSKVFFNSVMPQSLNQQKWHLVGTDPKNISSSWGATFDAGLLTASVNLSALNHSYTPPSYGGGYSPTTYYTYSVPGGGVSLSADGMTLSPKGSCIVLNFTKAMRQQYTEHYNTPYLFGSDSGDTTLSSDYTLNISSNMPVQLSGAGRDQKISIATTDKYSVITGHLSGGGPCGCGDDLQAQFNQQLQAQLPTQISNQMNVSFNQVSLFALKNLLFVNNNFINFTAANVPGDLLITGKFVA